MKPWDGQHGQYQHPLDLLTDWNMQIDDTGTIWYMTHEREPHLAIWCPASCLTGHMHMLERYKPSPELTQTWKDDIKKEQANVI